MQQRVLSLSIETLKRLNSGSCSQIQGINGNILLNSEGAFTFMGR